MLILVQLGERWYVGSIFPEVPQYWRWVIFAPTTQCPHGTVSCIEMTKPLVFSRTFSGMLSLSHLETTKEIFQQLWTQSYRPNNRNQTKKIHCRDTLSLLCARFGLQDIALGWRFVLVLEDVYTNVALWGLHFKSYVLVLSSICVI